MAINEEERQHLYRRLDETIGHRAATTLIEYLPPVGWADVATKRDLEILKVGLEATLHRELSSQYRDLVRSTMSVHIASLAAFGSLLVAAVKI